MVKWFTAACVAAFLLLSAASAALGLPLPRAADTVARAQAIALNPTHYLRRERQERARLLYRARLDGEPFHVPAMVSAIETSLASGRPDAYRDPRELATLLEEVAVASVVHDLPLETMLTVGWHETRWRWWRASPSGRYCGPFQQAAQYVMPSPKYVPYCPEHADCAATCARLRSDYRFAVVSLVRYLEIIRARTGDIAANICRYQGGAYGDCNAAARAYGERHHEYRETMLAAYHEAVSRLAYTPAY